MKSAHPSWRFLFFDPVPIFLLSSLIVASSFSLFGLNSVAERTTERPTADKCLDETLFEQVTSSAANLQLEDREWLLADIASYEANLNQFDAALRTVGRMKDRPSINDMLAKLALWQADRADFSGARSTAKGISEKHPYVFVQIAVKQAEYGDLQGALASIPHISPEDRDTVLEGKITYDLRRGDVAAALRTVEMIHDKDSAWWSIMFEQAKAGDTKAAFQTGELIKDRGLREQVRDGIVNARIEAKDFANAKQIADQLPPGLHARVLYDIGEAQAMNGLHADAELSFNEAAKMALQESSDFGGLTLGIIAEHEIRLGLPVNVMSEINALPDGYEKREALIEVGKAKLALGEAAEAEAAFRRAPYPALAAVAKAAQGDLKGAFDTLRLSDESTNVDAYLVDVAEQLARHGRIEAAVSVIPRIDGSLRYKYQAEAIQKIAKARAQQGDSQGALTWATQQKDPFFRASALFGVLQGNLEKCEPNSTVLL